MNYTLHHGDNREVLRTLPDNSVDSIVSDPPYELGFMGKRWDSTGIAYDVTLWAECLRVLKPGGHLLAFGGSRTYHRLAVAIEDAGFEIRDCIMWLYSTGFPKGLDVAWQMHKKASITCGIMVVDENTKEHYAKQDTKHKMRFVRASYLSSPVYACAQCGQVLQPFMQEQSSSQLRQAWQKSEVSWTEQSCMERWGDAEKTKGQLQRCEVCTLSHGVFADGSQGRVHHGASFGDGAIPWQITNEDGSRPSYRPQSIEQLHNQLDAFLIECRAQKVRGYNVALKPAHEPIVVARKPLQGTVADNVQAWGVGGINIDGCRIPSDDGFEKAWDKPVRTNISNGSATFGTGKSAELGTHVVDISANKPTGGRWPANIILDEEAAQMLDKQSGGASRFFYIPKASKAEREAGLEGMRIVEAKRTQSGGDDTRGRPIPQNKNIHPTVKPIALMRYLVRMVTPRGGVVLDPFMGSGSTGCAAMLEGVDFVGIELNAEYLEIAERRIAHHAEQNPMGL